MYKTLAAVSVAGLALAFTPDAMAESSPSQDISALATGSLLELAQAQQSQDQPSDTQSSPEQNTAPSAGGGTEGQTEEKKEKKEKNQYPPEGTNPHEPNMKFPREN